MTHNSRRVMLRTLLGGTALLTSGLVRATFAVPARTPGDASTNDVDEARLVFIILRGGMDGLTAVAPYADPEYARARGPLALPPPGTADGALDLDGFFGLHPKLAQLHGLYGAGELLIVQAVCSPYRGRSHFDGQNVLECGAPVPFGLDSGWLNRALEPAHRSALSRAGASGIALSSAVPLALRGTVAVTSWSPSHLQVPPTDLVARVASLYEHDAKLANAFAEAQMARGVMGDVTAAARSGLNARQNVEEMMRAAGAFLVRADGPRVAMLEATGWDSHTLQGQPQGALQRSLAMLDDGVAALRSALGPVWQRTVVVIASEFGRTVAMNGTAGTDHGTGGALLLAGGALRGKRVLADWPGLGVAQRYEGRDLKTTIDLRAVLKGVLHDHLHVADGHLEARVFPDSVSAGRIEGLIRDPRANI